MSGNKMADNVSTVKYCKLFFTKKYISKIKKRMIRKEKEKRERDCGRERERFEIMVKRERRKKKERY